jgi:hypothetical protein
VPQHELVVNDGYSRKPLAAQMILGLTGAPRSREARQKSAASQWPVHRFNKEVVRLRHSQSPGRL